MGTTSTFTKNKKSRKSLPTSAGRKKTVKKCGPTITSMDIKLDFHVPLEKIASIGGAPLSRRANNHWKLQDLVSTTLQSKLKTAPAGSKIYLWLQSETVMDGQTHEQTLVPILIGAVCKTERNNRCQITCRRVGLATAPL
jgi:hypothetical protein